MIKKIRDVLVNNRRLAILTILAVYLMMIGKQAEAAVVNTTQKIKPTPSPTIDPILYQGSGISITITAGILVLIVIFGVVFTLTRQK